MIWGIKRNLRYMHWQIAYRKKGEEKFTPVPNPDYAWAADPFLIEYKGKLLLFAELFLYKSERNGVIGYCEYKGDCFGEWIVSMDEHWHLSYPNVFMDDGELYMCPESYQKKEVGLYQLMELPDKWIQRETLISNVKWVDSTFLKYNDKDYLFSFEPRFDKDEGTLLMMTKGNDGKYSDRVDISKDKSVARPGGNFYFEAGKLYRVSQNCQNSYGEAVVISEVDSVEPQYREHVVKKLSPSNVVIDTKHEVLGIHTYNQVGDYEVIDYKYYEPSLAEAFAAKRTRKVFTNKYRSR